nr:zinc finger BED domain-containing protein RICESLEEPER 2-like [Ipomoea batatas]
MGSTKRWKLERLNLEIIDTHKPSSHSSAIVGSRLQQSAPAAIVAPQQSLAIVARQQSAVPQPLRLAVQRSLLRQSLSLIDSPPHQQSGQPLRLADSPPLQSGRPFQTSRLAPTDGLSSIKTIVDDVRNSVLFINQSESRLLKFSEIVHHLGNPVRDALYDLFYEYVESDNMKNRKGSFFMPHGELSVTSTCSTSKGKVVLSGLSLYDKYLDSVEDATPNKSEFDIYLEEGVYRRGRGQEPNMDKNLPVGRALGSINELVSKAFSNGLDVPESTLTGTACEEIDCLVHTAKRRNINSLASDNTSRTDTGRIFSWSTTST